MDKLVKLLLGILLLGNLVWLRIPGKPVAHLTNKYIMNRVGLLEKLSATLSLRKGIIRATDLYTAHRCLEIVCLRILIYKLILIKIKEILVFILDSLGIKIIVLSNSLQESVHHKYVPVGDNLFGRYERHTYVVLSRDRIIYLKVILHNLLGLIS